MASLRTTFTLDKEVAERGRLLGVNISAAARHGVVATAVREAMSEADRQAYLRRRERVDGFWTDADVWGDP